MKTFDSGKSRAVIAQNAAGDLTVREPVYVAGSPIGILLVTLVLGFACWLFTAQERGVTLPAWYPIPIFIEAACIWAIACFSHKTSILRHDGVLEQRVDFLPALAAPTPGAQAIAYGRVVTFGRYGKVEQFPVSVRFADNSAYALVQSAPSLAAAASLATQLSAAAHLPLESKLVRGPVTGGMAKLIAITLAACAFPIAYVAAMGLTAQPAAAPPPPALQAALDAAALTVSAENFGPPYDVAPKGEDLVEIPFSVMPLGPHSWRLTIPVAGFKGYDVLRIRGDISAGEEENRYVKVVRGVATVVPTRPPAPDPVVGASADATMVTIDAMDLNPPYEVLPNGTDEKLPDSDVNVTPAGAHHYRIAVPARLLASPKNEFIIQGVLDNGALSDSELVTIGQ